MRNQTATCSEVIWICISDLRITNRNRSAPQTCLEDPNAMAFLLLPGAQLQSHEILEHHHFAQADAEEADGAPFMLGCPSWGAVPPLTTYVRGPVDISRHIPRGVAD